MRREALVTWAIGLAFGAATGFMVLVGGPPLLMFSLPVLALAFVAARSLSLLSGAFIGVGGVWLVLIVRAQYACATLGDGPNRGCQGFGVESLLVVSAVVIAIGLAIGVFARRRRAAHSGATATDATLSR